jgi:hypothetical protein
MVSGSSDSMVLRRSTMVLRRSIIPRRGNHTREKLQLIGTTETQAARANSTVHVARMAGRTKRNAKVWLLKKGKEEKATGQTAPSAIEAHTYMQQH